MKPAILTKKQIPLPLIFILLLTACGEKGSDSKAGTINERWYTQAQVEQGQITFEKNCAECHGTNAQGTLKWMDALPDGTYPPPPLNGTAHAWHHSLSALKRTIYFGGVRLGGTMPPFKDALDNDDMDAVIAYFQSKWNDKIYNAWLERDGLK